MNKAACTAVVTACDRMEQTFVTIAKIQRCCPAPTETIVHVDAGQIELSNAIKRTFPMLTVLYSEASIGPGGARNKLLAAANQPIVASFDDDSYPIDEDYFVRLEEVFERFPAATIVCGAVYHRGERVREDIRCGEWVSDFIGCGSSYRRDEFLATSGYVPLPVAYGMEEVDLALRLHARGKRILRTPWLRVFHDTDLRHHGSSRVTAASIANLTLLAYLRYPVLLWPLGLLQCLSRIGWLLRNGRNAGIISGLTMIPSYLREYGEFRELVEAKGVVSYLASRGAGRAELF